MVDEKNAERIVVLGVGKANAGWPNRRGKSQVEDERRISLLPLFGDIGDADAENGAVVQDPP